MYVSLTLVAFCSLFITTSPIAAAGNPIGYDKVCLKATKVIIKNNGKTVRKRDLTGTGLPIGKKIYIVGITQSKAGRIITTGNQAADQELAPFGAKYVAGVMQYLEGSPTMTTQDGNIHVVLGAVPTYQPARHTPAQFFAVFPREPKPTSAPGEGGTIGGLQQGPLTLEQIFAPGSTQDCASIAWDPEGRVFDANTLEPMENVKVTLLNSEKKPVNQIEIVNPDTTDILGNYTFYVEEGDYYLTVKAPAGYEMITADSQVNPGYAKAYYNLYTKDSIIVERIDTPEEQMQEAPNVEHRDIPLISKTGKTIRPLSVLSHTEIGVDDGTLYEGQTSHPLTKITILQGGQAIAQGEADKSGAYAVPVSSALIDPQVPVDLSYEKVDLTKDVLSLIRKYIGIVYAEVNSITIRTQPLIRHIDGYAFDQNGRVMSFAVVNIRLTDTGEIAIQTNADKDGHFTIPDGTEPSFPFYFEFVDPTTNKSVRKETSEFSVNNKLVGEYDKERAMQNRKQFENTPPTQPTQKPVSSPGATQDIAGYLIILFVVVVFGGVGAYLYVQKRKTEASF